jgi:hypothetical protein
LLVLILGGAAVYRRDTWLIFRIGFSRSGAAATLKTFFPQPVQPYRPESITKFAND